MRQRRVYAECPPFADRRDITAGVRTCERRQHSRSAEDDTYGHRTEFALSCMTLRCRQLVLVYMRVRSLRLACLKTPL